jgi:hypothetical protein
MQLRLRSALSLELSDETRRAHIASIEAVLRELPIPVVTLPKRAASRRWIAATTVVATTLSPVGVAVAAERAVPGEQLYEVKLVTETIRAAIDPLVPARHRVDELEALMERGAEPSLIQAALVQARASVDPLKGSHALVERLEQLEESLNESEVDDLATGDPGTADDGASTPLQEEDDDDDSAEIGDGEGEGNDEEGTGDDDVEDDDDGSEDDGSG